MTDETRAERQAALAEALAAIAAMEDEEERRSVAYAGRMAAEAILCALPLEAPRDALQRALGRLREVDELVWACACVSMAGADGEDGGTPLYAGRWHNMGAR